MHREKLQLRLNGTVLEDTEPGMYALAITLVNALGQEASTIAEVTVAEAGGKPSIVVFSPGGSSDASAVTVQLSRGLRLHSRLALDSVCKGVAARVVYQWRCSAADGSACDLPSAAARATQLRLEPSQVAGMKPGIDYTFELTAGFTGSSAASSASTARLRPARHLGRRLAPRTALQRRALPHCHSTC